MNKVFFFQKLKVIISPTIFGRHLFFFGTKKQLSRMSPGVWKLRWSLADFVEMEKNLGYFETRRITFSGTSPGFGISSQHFLAIFPTSLRQDIPSLYLPEGSWWRSRIFFWRWNSPQWLEGRRSFEVSEVFKLGKGMIVIFIRPTLVKWLPILMNYK